MTNSRILLLVILFGICFCKERNPCEATVEYTAATGDPAKSNNSAIFRGFTRVLFNSRRPLVENSVGLRWTFTGGETIQGEKDIFEDVAPENPTEFVLDIDFGSLTKADTQSVQLAINTSNRSTIRLGFIGYKGVNVSTSSQSSIEASPVYQVALPDELFVDDLACEPSPVLFKAEQFASQPKEDMPVLNTGLSLDYLPLEFRNLRFTLGFHSSFTIFAFKLINGSKRVLNLSNVVIEYWFDGGNDVETFPDDSTSIDSKFKSDCMVSSLSCSLVNLKIEKGLKDVIGARYKLVISFDEKAGLLPPYEMDQDPNSVDGIFEAIVNITSMRFFSQMDVLSDYSFRNTSILDGLSNLPDQLVPRDYEPNPLIPIYENNTLVWGSPPTAGKAKVNLTELSEEGRQCWLKSNSIRQCGLKMRYCCQKSSQRQTPITILDRQKSPSPSDPPVTLLNNDDDDKDNPIPIWAIGLLIGFVMIAFLVCSILCFYSYQQKNNGSFVSFGDDDGNENTRFVTQDQFGSFAWSIVNPIANDDDETQTKESLLTEKSKSSLVLNETKFHTVPSICEMDSYSLVELLNKKDQVNNASPKTSRSWKTWTGHVHWIWESWDVKNVRRARTTIASASSSSSTPGPKFASLHSLSTRKISYIPLDVDYKNEIEPYLGELLGEGGFGQVYFAKWKGEAVAVKVMKVDTETMHKHLKDEVKLTSQMCHDRIVRLLGACLTNKDNVCLIMELIENGNLSKRIHNRKLRRMEYLEVLQIGFDIAEGLSYLHPSIIHRDLKPQNVLLDKDCRAKIADFGISKFKDPHRSYLSVTQTGGTPNYMAPELFNGTRVDEKCDIYSLGCILYETMTRRVPLSDLPSENCAPLFQIIKTVAIDKRRPKIPEFFPHGLAELIRQCWKDNPSSRPSASEACAVLEHLIEGEIARIEQARQAHFDTPSRQLSGYSTNKRVNRNLDTTDNMSLPSDQMRTQNNILNSSTQIE
eukprot:g963.t1